MQQPAPGHGRELNVRDGTPRRAGSLSAFVRASRWTGVAAAADYRSIADPAAVRYDAPSAKAKPLFVLGRDTPLEVIVPCRGLEQGARCRGHDRLGRTQVAGGQADPGSCGVRSPRCARIPKTTLPLVFRAEQNVLLDLAETASSAATTTAPGWVKVRHRDGQTGFNALRRCSGSSADRARVPDDDVGRGARRGRVGNGARVASRSAATSRVTLWARERPGATQIAASRRKRSVTCPASRCPRRCQ